MYLGSEYILLPKTPKTPYPNITKEHKFVKLNIKI